MAELKRTTPRDWTIDMGAISIIESSQSDISVGKDVVAVCYDCGGQFNTVRWSAFPDAGQVRCDECLAIFVTRRDAWRDRERINEMLNKSGILPKFTAYDHSRDVRGYLDWIMARLGKNIILIGNNDTGKTHCLMHAAWKVAQTGKSVMTGRTTEIFRGIAGLLGKDVHGANQIIERTKRLDLLVMDDLGKETLTDRSLELLFEIMDARIGHRRPTWISTNHNGAELQVRLGDNYGSAVIARIRAEYDWIGKATRAAM